MMVRFQASAHIVAYWREGRFFLHQFASGRQVIADPAVVHVLHACRTWSTLDDIVAASDLPRGLVAVAVQRLCETSLLYRSDGGEPPHEAAYRTWGRWNPAAGFFHSATRDVAWAPPAERRVLEEALADKSHRIPAPPPVKRLVGAKATRLPPPRRDGEFASVLLTRRTWRSFSRRPIPLAQIATLLGLTGGVQMWGTTSAGERVPFKTSPSAGSKHPLELYLMARRVIGLAPGVYHYRADRHRLELIKAGATVRDIQRYLGHQWYFKHAAAVVFLTAVMPRTQWTYSYARAYRSVLAEAGHACQTFCLVATWLDLAPFCTMAVADSLVEKTLGIDGVTETVLYAAGVGSKPLDGKWVQWPEHAAESPYLPPKRNSTRRVRERREL
jgi:SagB-type dehydrogenase family enzyme